MAQPKKVEKTTICSTSLRAMASMIEVGKTWPRKSLSERPVGAPAPTGPIGAVRWRDEPGCSRLTMATPTVSEITVAPRKKPSVFRPTRPTADPAPRWAMPLTRVEKTSGAMIILIRRRKTSVIRPK